ELGDRGCCDADIPQVIGSDVHALYCSSYLAAGVSSPEFCRTVTFFTRLISNHSASIGATLLATSSGNVGLSFNAPRVGDHVALLGGADVPLILTPTVE